MTGNLSQGYSHGPDDDGAGTILKMAEREEIKGLTTAASIWLTAAIGIAAAVGPLWVPVVCATCAWVVLCSRENREQDGSSSSPVSV